MYTKSTIPKKQTLLYTKKIPTAWNCWYFFVIFEKNYFFKENLPNDFLPEKLPFSTKFVFGATLAGAL